MNMMARSSLDDCIQFDSRAYAFYYSGELVSGTVNINRYKPKKYKEIEVRFLGTATVRWAQSQNKHTVHYKAEQLYFKTYTHFLNTHTNDGEQKFAFSFLLPPNLPSSYIGRYGEIKYEVKVTAKTASFNDFCYRVLIQVLANINLNAIPKIRSPTVVQKSQELYFFFSKRGNVQMTFETQYQGFVPGQNILLKCRIKNASKVKILKIKFSLHQVIIFNATHPRSKRKTMQSVIACTFGEGVDKHQDKDVLTRMIIPGIPSSTLNLCNVVNISYFLEAATVLDGIHYDLTCQIPIIMGTVPLQEYAQSISDPAYPTCFTDVTPLPSIEQTQIAGPSTSTSPQTQHPSDLPTYEDVLRANFGVHKNAEQFAPSAPNLSEETSPLSSNSSGGFSEGRPFVSSVCDSKSEGKN